MRVQYHYEVIGDVIVIYDDHNLSGKSKTVTNAAEEVIAEVGKAIGGFGGRRVVYRDSNGVFDELVLDAEGRFAAFGFLRADTLDAALDALARTPAC